MDILVTDQNHAEAPSGDETPKDNRKAMVERRLMEEASLLFARKGYSGTTLSDIAEAVGLTRAAVYYYFKNKEALLEALIEDVTSAPAREYENWLKTAPEDCVERLRSFVRLRVRGVLSRQIQMRMIAATEAILPPDLMERHTRARRGLLDAFRSMLRDGMEKGAFRAQDDRIAAFAINGMIGWTTTWFVPDRGRTLDEVADQIADMAVQSVIIQGDRSASFGDAASAVRALREDIDQLEMLIGTASRT